MIFLRKTEKYVNSQISMDADNMHYQTNVYKNYLMIFFIILIAYVCFEILFNSRFFGFILFAFYKMALIMFCLLILMPSSLNKIGNFPDVAVTLRKCLLYIEKQYDGFCRLIIITLRNGKTIRTKINMHRQFVIDFVKNYQFQYFLIQHTK
jgi:hypothetical protein